MCQILFAEYVDWAMKVAVAFSVGTTNVRRQDDRMILYQKRVANIFFMGVVATSTNGKSH